MTENGRENATENTTDTTSSDGLPDGGEILDDAKSVSPLVEDVETRAKGASQSGAIDDLEVQPRWGDEAEPSHDGRTPESPEIEKLLNTPLDDRSVMGSGSEADPLKSRGGTRTQTDVR